MSDQIRGCLETIGGCTLALMSSGLLLQVIHGVTVTAELIGTVTGAIIGIVGVWRLWRGSRP